MIRRILFAALAAFLFSTAIAEDRFCQNELFTIDARYDAGAFARCKFKSDDMVELTFRSEDRKVDDAFAWFAFRVFAEDARTVRIRLKFPDAYARYWPKLSSDGLNWEPAAGNTVERSRFGKSMEITVSASTTGTWVAAQELMTSEHYGAWFDELSSHNEIQTAVIGQSIEGRPIRLAKTANKPEAIVLLGRQHPAEVPGAVAMQQFVNVVLGDTDLAREFRERYMLLILPLMNPDGVANGHARHNAGQTDLNRDWGPFTQPETKSVANLLADLDKLEIQPRLMLDFHATKMTPTMVFYTQMPEDGTDPALFATNWLLQVDDRITDYEFTHDPRSPSGLDNTKNYFFSRYGIPAITYEIGDEADRGDVIEHTPVFAEEMMRVMLQAERP